jgi:hypothetical protein
MEDKRRFTNDKREECGFLTILRAILAASRQAIENSPLPRDGRPAEPE